MINALLDFGFASALCGTFTAALTIPIGLYTNARPRWQVWTVGVGMIAVNLLVVAIYVYYPPVRA